MKKRLHLSFLYKRSIILIILALITTFSGLAQRTPTLGSTDSFDTNPTYLIRTARLDDTHIIAVYKSASSSVTAVSSDLYAIVGTVDTNTKTISWGTRFTIEAEDQSRPFVVAISATQAVVGYEYAPGDDIGRARVVTISGNTISSVGSATNFSSGDYTWASAIHLGSGKIAIAYDDLEASAQGTVVIGDVTGSSISFGSPQNYNSVRIQTPDIKAVSSSRFVIAYEEDGTSFDPGKVIIGDVSGTGITYGSAATFASSGSTNAVRETSVAVFNSSSIAVAYSDDSSSDEGKVIVGTITGSDVTFGGTAVEYENNFSVRDTDIEVISGNEFVLVHNGSTTSDPGKVIIGERNGNNITFGAAITYLSAQADDNRVTVLTDNSFAICFTDDTGTPIDQGEYVVGTLPSLATAPSVTSSSATAITVSGATLNGNVTDDGGAGITERGFVYSVTTTDGTPTVTESSGSGVTKVIVSGTTGTFNQVVSSLTAGTGYSFAPYATNNEGTTEGTVQTFTTTSLTTPTITFANISKTYGDANFTLGATSNSAGIITYSIEGVNTTGTALSGTNNATVNLENVGGLTIRATQAADGIYSSTTKDITLTINVKELAIINITGDDKVYDGNTNATVSGTAELSGVEIGDTVLLGGSPVFTFASSEIGFGIIINGAGYVISGADSGNYSLTQPVLSADITSVLGLEDASLNKLISLYPNPVNNLLHIKSNKPNILEVTLLDVLGKSIKNIILKNDTVDFSGINSGMYLLKIKTEHGLIVKRIIRK
ncbi:YDG domain-containing protein [Tamlana sp. 2201CG12-4]|uniref:T9SS type A sorting domain-containing protein n=1 Tax=Tamlana sp. 2201CG12-4 TaxID=3112582 RepID=UPI002DBDDA0B|nr:YDG domain-containing protein [Tamlana sp. 2201CG12-4]MEC3905817.1 YDG domain-containing protein [Tamlana sp. 2201CG12-4]